MKNNENIIILKGDTENANYKVQSIEEYAGNPFIEALPDIFSEDDVIDRFSILPNISDEDRRLFLVLCGFNYLIFFTIL